MTERFLNNPIHIRPYELLNVCCCLKNGAVLLSTKADGVYTQIEIDKDIYEAELVGDIYYLFDILSYPKHYKNTYLDRLNYINKKYKQEPVKIVTSYQEFVEELLIDDNNIKKQLATNKVVVKPTYLIKTSTSDFLNILDINLDMLSYPTDGFIIVIDQTKFSPYKYKPKNMLTVDLYNDYGSFKDKDGQIIFKNKNNLKNGVWRCRNKFTELKPIMNMELMQTQTIEHNIWEEYEFRTDKIIPNASYIIEELTNMHLNYWKALDLLPYTEKTKQIYYGHQPQTTNLSNSVTKMLEYFQQVSRDEISEIIKTNNCKFVLDIGCGKSNVMQFNKATNFKYIGIDFDPVVISYCKEKYKKNHSAANWLWADINQLDWKAFKDPVLSTISKMLKGPKAENNLIIIRNSINYVDQLDVFFNNLSQLCKSNTNTIVYIMFIDLDVIQELATDMQWFTEDIKIKKITNEVAPWANEVAFWEFSYSWLNNGQFFRDKVVSCTEIISNLEKYNFIIKSIEILKKDDNQSANINKFIQLHKIIQATFITT